MALVDDALNSLLDLRARLERQELSCHVFIHLRRGRERDDRWKRLIAEVELLRQFVDTIVQAIIAAQVVASEPDGIAEFDFEAIAAGALGVLLLEEFPDLQGWLEDVPANDWDEAFRPTQEARQNLNFYAMRLNVGAGNDLLAFRSSRGAKIFIEQGGIRAFFQRDGDVARPAESGFMSFDEKIDFFTWDGLLFIASLGAFESLTNVRVITQRHAHAAVDAIAGRFELGDVGDFKATISSKISLAKKLAAAVRHGLIDDIDIARTIARIQEKGLDIPAHEENGRLRFDINPADVRQVTEIVNLVSDVYLHSPVTRREWRAIVKRPG